MEINIHQPNYVTEYTIFHNGEASIVYEDTQPQRGETNIGHTYYIHNRKIFIAIQFDSDRNRRFYTSDGGILQADVSWKHLKSDLKQVTNNDIRHLVLRFTLESLGLFRHQRQQNS